MAEEPNAQEQPLPKGLTDAQIEARAEQLLVEKYGDDPRKMYKKLFRDGVIIKRQLDDALARSVPKGHVVVTKEEADLLETYKALGTAADLSGAGKALETYKALGTADELKAAQATLADYQAIGDTKAVKAAVEELPQLKGTLARREREAELAAVEKVAGYVSPVLRRLAADDLKFVPTKEKVKNRAGVEKEIDTYLVKDTGPDGKERTRTLAEWEASDDVKPMLPALRPEVATEVVRGRDVLPVSTNLGPRPGDRRVERRPVQQEVAAERPNLAANF